MSQGQSYDLTPCLCASRLGVPGNVRYCDQERRVGSHDGVELRDDCPRENRRGSPGSLCLGIESCGPDAIAVLGGPYNDAQTGGGHDDRLDGEQVLDTRRMDEQERYGEDEGEEESNHGLRGYVLVRGYPIGDLIPRGEDAPEADGDELALKVELHAAPDDAQDGAQHHDKELAVDAKAGPRKYGITNVVA